MKKPLGELLLAEGIITRDELNEAIKLSEKSPLKLGQILQKKGLADEDQILQLLSKQYGFRFTNKLNFKYDESFAKIPIQFIERARMVPVGKSGNLVTVAVNNPSDLHQMDDMKSFLKGQKVEFVVTNETEIMRIIHSNFDQAQAAAKEVMEGFGDDEFADLDSLGDGTLDLANEAPIIRMVNAIFSQAVQERASDIHIEPYEKRVDVRYRIDGILHKRLSPPRVVLAGLVSRIKIMANLNIAENRLPQDGRIKIKLAGKDVDIRVSTIPTRYGERVVMRLLNKTDIKFSLENMGFLTQFKVDIRRILKEPNGIMLVTGPTGSGKSTTLYAFLSEVNEEGTNILTAEDPIEYEIEGISQMQMQEKIGLNFATALRAFLRQDPDIIMVGEIRDEETARIAVQAALTGHLVFSTLHTNDSPSAVTRLVDMGIEPYLITSTVRAVLAQRLVRVLCPKCKAEYHPSAKELTDLGVTTADLQKGTIFKAVGCENCVNTGYRGRLGIYELLEVSESIQSAVLRGADAETLRKAARSEGMMTLREYGREKVLEGITTVEEVLRVT